MDERKCSLLHERPDGLALVSLLRLVLSASAFWILLGSVPAKADMPLVLADPSLPLASAWEHRSFGEPTDYSADVVDGVAAIRAEGRVSASGLYRRVHYTVRDHPWLEWSWRVDAMQRTADIRLKERQDFAAAIFLIFGQPSVLRRNVPTLAYVWTSAGMLTGDVVESPRRKDVIRFMVIKSGHGNLGRWMHERRNVVRDFRRAFGREPPEEVELIAVFTDNDQTKEPVETYYGFIRAYATRPLP